MVRRQHAAAAQPKIAPPMYINIGNLFMTLTTMVLPKMIIGTDMSMPKMSSPQWLPVTPTIPNTLSNS